MAAPDEEFLRKLREVFGIEAREHLQALSTGLLGLEKAADRAQQQAIVETIFREAHSLKGAARSVNRDDLEMICQALESVFSRWKTDGIRAEAQAFDVLNGALDFAERSLETGAPDPQQLTTLVQQVRALEEGGSVVPIAPLAPVEETPEPPRIESRPVAHTVRIATAKLDALLLQAEEMIAIKNSVEQRSRELTAADQMMAKWRTASARTGMEIQRLRAGNDRLAPQRAWESLERNQSELRAVDHQLSALAQAAERDEREIRAMVDDLLRDAKRMMMLPFSTLLELFPNQVRSLARAQGKEVDLRLRGRGVEIDKRILEQMKDPLIHLVRNAVDHGFEDAATRATQGKAARGTLTIAVSQIDAGKVEILVSDDGAGIDLDQVKAAVINAGLVSSEDMDRRTETEALQLIFLSGISTSGVLTEISGRGLGMAIVRERVEALGGHIEIDTAPRRGTTFRMILPVTLATFKGLLIVAGGEHFIVPTLNVERVLRIEREKIQTVENKETISWDGRAVSLVWLDAVLGLERREPVLPTKFIQVAILGVGETRIAFAMDEVMGEQEVLVKPLQKPLVHVRNIAAATVLGSGKTVLILNVPELLQSATEAAGRVVARPAAPAERKTRAILVADDSVTSRMLLKNILEAAGYSVTTAVDGAEAWTVLKTRSFDAVVSDVQMPRMDGFDLTAKLRADSGLREVPVVLVTALESREHRERGIEVGANAYLVKSSFDQSNLLDVVRGLL
ncbi:MAG: two-component system, chemotaxis family, sensor kinase CheA [Chthoniobacter sp.]|jgi:two-component system chemotaxis sensor kinase CheA|nr:two-component system, chemotaxis family, sensor kinase CheA [Chthoniobacter sp.]